MNRPTFRSSNLYVRVIACIVRKPMTSAEIAAELDIGKCSVYPVVRMLRGTLVHISAYKEGCRGGTPAVWSFGPGDEPKRPAHMVREVAHKRRSELLSFLNLARCLTREPMSIRQIIEETGMTWSTVQKTLRAAKAAGFAYIAEWDRIGPTTTTGPYSPHWMFGVGQRDATKPRNLTRKEIERRSWAARTAKARQVQMLTALASNAELIQQRA